MPTSRSISANARAFASSTDPAGRRRLRRGGAAAIAVVALIALPLSAAAASWSIVTSPDTSTTQDNELISVGCADATECWAVGWYNDGTVDQALIEENTGSGWSIVTSPDSAADQNNYLFSVTCAGLSDCWAVGYYEGADANQTLIEHYDGTSWTIFTSPDSDASVSNVLYGVSCVSATDCWAAGDNNPSGSADQTLVEHYDGSTWSIIGTPDTSATDSNSFSGIACVSSTDCWAAGDHTTGGADETLIEQYNGTSWSIVSSPDTSATANDELFAVACAGASECWVAGFSDSTGQEQTLIEEYNGTSWSLASAPDTSATEDNFLFDVTCASTAQCVAVGDYNDGSVDQTLIEENTGSGWTIDSSPDTSTTDNNDLSGVTCTAVDACLAVGGSYPADTNSGNEQTLIEQSSAPETSVPEWPVGGAAGIALGALVLLAAWPRLRTSWGGRTAG